jgi:hypothetical protein
MVKIRIHSQKGKLLTLAAFFFLSTESPAQAFGVTFDAGVFVQAENASATSEINTTTTPDGFGSFFDNDPNTIDDFVLLGAQETDSNISSDSYRGILNLSSTALSNSFTLSTQQVSDEITVNFDWIFQGNSTGTITSIPPNVDVDTFTFTLVGLGSLSNVEQTLVTRLNSNYGSQRGESFTINANVLQAGDYALLAELVESPDSALHSSAAGIDNVSISAVPFNFSPTLGLVITGGFWRFLDWQRRKNKTIRL